MSPSPNTPSSTSQMKNTYETFASLTVLKRDIGHPQPDLWQSDAVEWHMVKRMPDYAPRRKRTAVGDVVQALLPEIDAR